MIQRVKNKLSRLYSQYTSTPSEYSYIVIYYKKYNAAYFPIPKVANTSLLAASSEILKDEIPEDYYNIDWKARIFRNPYFYLFQVL